MCISDEDPVTQAFIPRRCTLTQKQWDTYLGSEEARPSASVAFDSFSSATGAAPVLRKEGIRRNFASKYDVEASNQNPKSSGRQVTPALHPSFADIAAFRPGLRT